MNNDFEKEINELIIKYNLEKNDPLFAFLEVQVKILKEIEKTSNNIQDPKIQKYNENMLFLFKEKISQTEKELDQFITNIKQKTIDELKDFNEEVNFFILKQNDNKKNKTSFTTFLFFTLFIITSSSALTYFLLKL